MTETLHPNREKIAAIDHYEFNMIGGWIGERTPIVIELFESNESNIARNGGR